VPEVKFINAIDRGRVNLQRFSIQSVGRKYFWGLDYATKKDATALAIGHLEMVEGHGVELIFDYIDRMMCGERFEGPGVEQVLVPGEEKYIKYTELDVPDIIRWLVYMHQVLPCHSGLTDQHAGTAIKQMLQINGITTFEIFPLDATKNSKMYNALKGFIEHGLARFPDVEKFEREFKLLEATYTNKYVLKVEAPTEKDAHDDMADATALVAYQAQVWLEEEGKLDIDPSGRALQVNPLLTAQPIVIDPNNISIRDLTVLDRQHRAIGGALAPPGIVRVVNPFGRPHPPGRRR
jgi:hypothetical protein